MYINYHVTSVCVWLCVAQHLTEALIATTNVDYVCSEKLHLYATPTFKNQSTYSKHTFSSTSSDHEQKRFNNTSVIIL